MMSLAHPFVRNLFYYILQIPQYCIHIASRQIASTATVATAKDYSAATAKIKRIIWGFVDAVSDCCSVCSFTEIYRAGFVDASATRLLRTSAATLIAKLDDVKV